MNIAIIKNGEVVNACVFDDLATAQEFLALGVWDGASAVIELPDGYGIGDSYDGTTWTKAPVPESPETPETPTTPTTTLGNADVDEALDIMQGTVNADLEEVYDIVGGIN